MGHGITADRCYSALVKDGINTNLKLISKHLKETTEVVDALERFADKLIELEDDIYNQKWRIIFYIFNH